MRDIKMIVVVVSMLFLSACASNIKLKDTGDVANDRVPPGPVKVCCVDPDRRVVDPLGELHSIPAISSIYFDYDGYIVKDEFVPLVEAHSKYLLSHKKDVIRIIGNTDERGGREYNLALGQKRADSVRKLFTLFGVPDGRIEAISLGAEKPKAEGSDEASWAENRRADIEFFSFQ